MGHSSHLNWKQGLRNPLHTCGQQRMMPRAIGHMCSSSAIPTTGECPQISSCLWVNSPSAPPASHSTTASSRETPHSEVASKVVSCWGRDGGIRKAPGNQPPQSTAHLSLRAFEGLLQCPCLMDPEVVFPKLNPNSRDEGM